MEFVFNSSPQIRFLHANVGRALLSLCATPGPHNSFRSILQHPFLLCSPSLGGGEGQRDQGVPLQTAGPQAPRTGDFGLGSASSG